MSLAKILQCWRQSEKDPTVWCRLAFERAAVLIDKDPSQWPASFRRYDAFRESWFGVSLFFAAGLAILYHFWNGPKPTSFFGIFAILVALSWLWRSIGVFALALCIYSVDQPGMQYLLFKVNMIYLSIIGCAIILSQSSYAIGSLLTYFVSLTCIYIFSARSKLRSKQ